MSKCHLEKEVYSTESHIELKKSKRVEGKKITENLLHTKLVFYSSKTNKMNIKKYRSIRNRLCWYCVRSFIAVEKENCYHKANVKKNHRSLSLGIY